MLSHPRRACTTRPAGVRTATCGLVLLLTAPLLTFGGPSIASGAPAGEATPANYADHTPPRVAVKVRSKRRTTLRFKGVPTTVTLDEPGSVSVVVRDPHGRQISAADTGIASVPNGGAVTVKVRLTQSAKSKLRHRKRVRWTVVATATDGVGNKTRKRVRLWIG